MKMDLNTLNCLNKKCLKKKLKCNTLKKDLKLIKKWLKLIRLMVSKYLWKKLYFIKLNKLLNRMTKFKINKYLLITYII